METTSNHLENIFHIYSYKYFFLTISLGQDNSGWLKLLWHQGHHTLCQRFWTRLICWPMLSNPVRQPVQVTAGHKLHLRVFLTWGPLPVWEFKLFAWHQSGWWEEWTPSLLTVWTTRVVTWVHLEMQHIGVVVVLDACQLYSDTGQAWMQRTKQQMMGFGP